MRNVLMLECIASVDVRDLPCIPLMLGTLAMNMAMKFARRDAKLVIFKRRSALSLEKGVRKELRVRQ